MKTTVFFKKHVSWGTYFFDLFLISLTLLFMVLLCFSPVPIRKLDLFHAHAKYNITKHVVQPGGGILEGNVIVKSWIKFGVSGACMRYRDEKPICERTFHFQPSVEYLHLPANQTLTEHMGDTNGLALHYVTTIFVLLFEVCFVFGPFIPGYFEYSCFFIAFAMIWYIIEIITISCYKFSIELRLLDDYPEFDNDIGGGCGLLIVVFIFLVSDCIIIGNIVSKIKLLSPPEQQAV